MSLRDPAEVSVVAECAYCGGEIYAGDEVMRIDDGGGYVHNGWRTVCADEYAKERVYDAEGMINDKGEIE